MPTEAEWRTILDRQLPASRDYVARNRAITACYARWYLQEPWLFKWAGMAAFASAQVGNGIALIEMLEAPHAAVRPAGAIVREANVLKLSAELYNRVLSLALFVPLVLHDAATRPLLLDDLELIKQANDAVFYDVGWMHLAYINGGIKELEANMPADAPLLAAFRNLDAGAQRLCDPTDCQTGMSLIQQGLLAMLLHEQTAILPAYMERMSAIGRFLASIGALLNLEGAPGFGNLPSFSNYFGPLAVATGSKSVANTTDRWEWIERDVLPRWQRLDTAYNNLTPMHRQLTALADESPFLLQQTADLMNFAYLSLGFNTTLRN